MTTTAPDTANPIAVPAHRDPDEYRRAMAERDREVALAQGAASTTGSDPVEEVSPLPRRGRGPLLAIALLAVVGIGAAVAMTTLRGGTEPVAPAVETAAPILVPSSMATVETAQPALPAASSPRSHIVERGDTLERIALRYDTTVLALLAVNELDNPDALLVGQVILLPAEGVTTDRTAN